ncbi:hypothetical protein LCGC14_2306450, partial [marine sediment metagenome]
MCIGAQKHEKTTKNPNFFCEEFWFPARHRSASKRSSTSGTSSDGRLAGNAAGEQKN